MQTEFRKVLVPVPVIAWAFKNKYIKEMALCVELKSKTSGRITSINQLTVVADSLGIKDSRTLKKYLRNLIKLHWICEDKKQKIYYVKSWTHIKKLLDISSRRIYVAQYNPLAILDFKIWAFAVLVSNQLRRANRRLKLRDQHSVRRSLKAAKTSYSLYPSIANITLAKMIGSSKATAITLKHLAEKEGYLTTEKRFKHVANESDHLKYLESGRFRIYKNHIWEQQPDEIHSLVTILRRSNNILPP